MNSDERMIPDSEADELAALIDKLMEGGSQHINLETGAESGVHTFNSTECGKAGACQIPTFDFSDAEEKGDSNGKITL